jgi:O-6-methylguanine DNA methyltransferase
MARNPVPIIVPCHRVLASDGTLGGYGGGLEIKETLLRLEGARL